MKGEGKNEWGGRDGGKERGKEGMGKRRNEV